MSASVMSVMMTIVSVDKMKECECDKHEVCDKCIDSDDEDDSECDE